MFPKVEVAKRPLHVIYIVDCSGSMKQAGKIQSVNAAMKEVIPSMRRIARDKPGLELFVRVLKFSTGAQWQVSQPTPIDQFEWTDLTADGETHLGAALRLLVEQLKRPPMPQRAYPPFLILVTDGYPTDDFSGGLKALNEEYWGRCASKAAISIGEDAARPEAQAVFEKFLGPEVKPLQANTAEEIVRYIRTTSTTASSPSLTPPAKGPDEAKEDKPKPDNQAPPDSNNFDF